MYAMRMTGVLSALRAAVSLGLLAPAAAAAVNGADGRQPPAMVIVFDATNSMWTQIDGANKVVLLRRALSRAFEAAQGKLEIGLLSYGSSEEAACTAIETVRPLGPVMAEDYARAVDQVPLGKGGTPLARALAEAANLADYETRPATLVVISDGLDNCRADPCAAAAQLKARSPGLSVHAIAFDQAQKGQLAALSCMATETGGTFYSATSGDELDKALAAVVALAANGAAPAMARQRNGAAVAAPPPATAGVGVGEEQPVSVSPPAPRIAKADAGETATLRLAARLTEDLPPLSGGLVWRVFAAEPDENGSFKVVARRTEARPEVSLAAGSYVVHVAYGRAKATSQVTVKDGVLDLTLVLNAGGLRLGAVGPDGRAIPPNSVSYALYSSEQDQFGQRKLIVASVPPGKVVRLNAGTYRVVSQYGDANAVVRADVTVEAGKLSEALVRHEAAKVTLKLVNEAGGEALANTSWRVQTPEGDVVAESVGAFPTHILAPGDYTITARHEGIAYSRKYSVELGYDQEVEIIAGTEEAQ